MSCKAEDFTLPVFDSSDENSCVVDYCMQIMDTARRDSCGECVFCREGTWQVYELIKGITEGKPRNDDYELIMEILGQIDEGSSCKGAKESASCCIRLMKEYEDDWDKHIRRKRCNNLVCRCSYTLYIDPLVCDGCGICLEAAPEGAISGAPGMIHILKDDSPLSAKLTTALCPKGAIKKAGAIKPKLPTEPIPVGSFGAEAEGGDGDSPRRRRRRG